MIFPISDSYLLWERALHAIDPLSAVADPHPTGSTLVLEMRQIKQKERRNQSCCFNV